MPSHDRGDYRPPAAGGPQAPAPVGLAADPDTPALEPDGAPRPPIDGLDRKRLELALEASGFDIWENDLTSGEVISGLRRVYHDLGFSPAQIAGRIDDIFDIMHPEDVTPTRRAIDDHLEGRTDRYYCEFRLRHRQGHWVWFANYGRIVDRGPGQASGRYFTGVSFNLEGQRREAEKMRALNARLAEQNALLESMNAELELLATIDELTGVRNRRCLIDSAHEAIARAQHDADDLALLVIDIDWFKQINDRWGHQAGDRVIRRVAQTFIDGVRDELDTVGRLGGEEFAIVLPRTSLAEAIDRAESLRAAVAAATFEFADGQSAGVTISVGATALALADDGFDSLFARADRALYAAKRAGRNRIRSGG